MLPSDPIRVQGYPPSERRPSQPIQRLGDIGGPLESVHLRLRPQRKSIVTQFRSDLSTVVNSAERQLSTGEKQLICLARVLLKDSPILVLDEATANIDSETDRVIQSVIRKEFAAKTVIAVAHRLSTIADFDQIIVLQNGRILEMGTPKQLW